MADNKQPLPSIDGDLSVSRRLQLPKMRSRDQLGDNDVEANAEELGRAWPAVATPKPELPSPPARPATIFESIRFNIPAYLNKELSRRAVEEDCTKTHLILRALSQSGYVIDPDDMQPDRRGSKQP
jgi:hypothetical protein